MKCLIAIEARCRREDSLCTSIFVVFSWLILHASVILANFWIHWIAISIHVCLHVRKWSESKFTVRIKQRHDFNIVNWQYVMRMSLVHYYSTQHSWQLRHLSQHVTSLTLSKNLKRYSREQAVAYILSARWLKFCNGCMFVNSNKVGGCKIKSYFLACSITKVLTYFRCIEYKWIKIQIRNIFLSKFISSLESQCKIVFLLH